MEKEFGQVSRIAWLLMIILAALPALTQPTWAAPLLPRTLSVDTSTDISGGACLTDVNDCSLRSAIERANADPGSTIIFEGTVRTIMLTAGPLPIITAANTTIRATTGQVIKLDATAQDFGLRVSGDRVRIQGLYVFGANLYNLHITLTAAQQVYIANNIIGNDDAPGCSTTEIVTIYGLYVTRAVPFTPGNHDVWIYGNRIECNRGSSGIGLTLDNIDRVRVGFKEPGSTATVETNTIRLNSYGIWLNNGASLNQIRGNVISANIADGIYISSLTTESNEIIANKIGTTADGLQDDGNGNDGIQIAGAQLNLIGGTPAKRNIIAGNGTMGINLSSNASGNSIQSNHIGVNLPGTAAIPNSVNGISINTGSKNNLIGGTLLNHLNVIGGNTLSGIDIRDAGTDSNTISFNDIGLNSALPEASQALPNGAYGMLIINGPQNTMVGSAATIAPRPASLAAPQASRTPLESQIIDPAANLIWYNWVTGIVIDNATNNLIRSNSIRKSDYGIYLRNNAVSNVITRTLMYENDSFGLIEDTGSTNNSWFELSMYGNNPNGRQISQSPITSRPRITSIARPSRTFQGTSGANALVEVYAHNAFIWTVNQTPVPEGQGRRFLGRTRADPFGRWSLQVAATALRGIQNNCFTAIETISIGTASPRSSDFSAIVCGKTYAPYAIKSSPQPQNVALRKFVESNGTTWIGSLLTTDGDRSSDNFATFRQNFGGPTWVRIDLEQSYTINRIKVWHYYSDGRTYRDVIVQVSNVADFSSGVTTVFNNDQNNSSGQGAGIQSEYAETSLGKELTFAPRSARYVRLWSNGNTVDSDNHYVEVEVYQQP